MIKSPIFLSQQVTQYVMFMMGRVGSTYLTHLLNSHPEILALSEELLDLKEEGAEAQMAWARDFLSPPLVGRYRVRGFNVKPHDTLDLDAFGRLLQEKQCKILHMQRRNRVKTAISVINGRRLAAQTGKWGLFDKANQPPSFTVDFEEFDRAIKHREEWDQKLEEYIRRLQLATLPMYYEDLLQDKDAFLDRVFTFLEVKPWPVEAKTLKITNDDLSKVIENFDELRGRYEETQYEDMFDEVLIERA